MSEQPKRVIVVDDEPMIGAALKRCVEIYASIHGISVSVETYTDGAEALPAAQRAPTPSLVMTDKDMRRLGGLALARGIRASFPVLPIALMSGRHLTAEEEGEVSRLKMAFFLKPFDGTVVDRILSNALLAAQKAPVMEAIVADDDRDNREAVALMLEDMFGTRIRIRQAADGRELLHLDELLPAAFIVTDKDMPVLDGLEATIALRRRKRAVPVAIMTGRPHDESLQDGGTIYNYAVFSKGTHLSQLKAWIETFVRS